LRIVLGLLVLSQHSNRTGQDNYGGENQKTEVGWAVHR